MLWGVAGVAEGHRAEESISSSRHAEVCREYHLLGSFLPSVFSVSVFIANTLLLACVNHKLTVWGWAGAGAVVSSHSVTSALSNHVGRVCLTENGDFHLAFLTGNKVLSLFSSCRSVSW